MPFKPKRVMKDVAAASAAYTVNLIPELAKLTMTEAFERLKLHYMAALEAYRFNTRRVMKIPKPSRN